MGLKWISPQGGLVEDLRYVENIFMMKTLTDFRKTVETGVDPRLLTDLKPLFIPSASLALKWAWNE